jgi:phage gp29-like protein
MREPKPLAKQPKTGNAVKRSVTVRRDLHDAILSSVGAREYSSFLNEALVMALQARGIEQSVASFEAQYGELTAEELREAARRRTFATKKKRR